MTTRLRIIIEMAKIFALVLITRFCCQSLIPSPASGRFMIQVWKRGEVLENKKADKIRKGVVGRIGRKAPIIPRAKLIHAMMKRIGFIISEKVSCRYPSQILLELKVRLQKLSQHQPSATEDSDQEIQNARYADKEFFLSIS